MRAIASPAPPPTHFRMDRAIQSAEWGTRRRERKRKQAKQGRVCEKYKGQLRALLLAAFQAILEGRPHRENTLPAVLQLPPALARSGKDGARRRFWLRWQQFGRGRVFIQCAEEARGRVHRVAFASRAIPPWSLRHRSLGSHGFLGKTASPRLGLTISQEATEAGRQVRLVVLERGNAAVQRFWTGGRGGRTRRQQSLEIGKGERSLCQESRLSVRLRRRRLCLLRSSPHLRVICAWNAGARFVALVTAPEQMLPLHRRRN